MKLDVIIPAYNKEKIVVSIYDKLKEELKNYKTNFIFIDNCSTDNTLETLKNIQKNDEDTVKIICLSKKSEDFYCILSGLNYSNAEYTCVYDMELNQNTSYIKKMITYLKENSEYDSVCMCNKTRNYNYFQRKYFDIAKKCFNYTNIKGKTNYRIYNNKMIKAILDISKTSYINSYNIDNIGFNTYYDTFKMNEMNNDKIIIPNNIKMFLLSMGIGLFNIIVSIILLLLTIILKLSFNYILLFMIILFNGIIIMFLGCIWKSINISIKNPYYIIKDKIGFEEDML